MFREVESGCEKVLLAGKMFADRRRVRWSQQRLREGVDTEQVLREALKG